MCRDVIQMHPDVRCRLNTSSIVEVRRCTVVASGREAATGKRIAPIGTSSTSSIRAASSTSTQ
jgi:hypothetical protein